MRRKEQPARRNQYRVCPLCGSHLDPGESCDCKGSNTIIDGKEVRANVDYRNKDEPDVP